MVNESKSKSNDALCTLLLIEHESNTNVIDKTEMLKSLSKIVECINNNTAFCVVKNFIIDQNLCSRMKLNQALYHAPHCKKNINVMVLTMVCRCILPSKPIIVVFISIQISSKIGRIQMKPISSYSN